MTKQEILNKLDELEAERIQIISEQEAINYVMSLSCSEEASRRDEIYHLLERRQRALDKRKQQWEKEISLVELEAKKIAA